MVDEGHEVACFQGGDAGGHSHRVVAGRKSARGDVAQQLAIVGDDGDGGLFGEGAADEGEEGEAGLIVADGEGIGGLDEAEVVDGEGRNGAEEGDRVEEVADKVLVSQPAEFGGGSDAIAALVELLPAKGTDGDHKVLRSVIDQIEGFQHAANQITKRKIESLSIKLLKGDNFPSYSLQINHKKKRQDERVPKLRLDEADEAGALGEEGGDGPLERCGRRREVVGGAEEAEDVRDADLSSDGGGLLPRGGLVRI